MSQNLVLTQVDTELGTVIVAHGDVDIASVDQLSAAMRLSDGEDFFVDLREVGFIDSAGLGALIREKRHCDDLGRRMTLVVESGPVMRLMDLVSLRDHFVITPNLATDV